MSSSSQLTNARQRVDRYFDRFTYQYVRSRNDGDSFAIHSLMDNAFQRCALDFPFCMLKSAPKKFSTAKSIKRIAFNKKLFKTRQCITR